MTKKAGEFKAQQKIRAYVTGGDLRPRAITSPLTL